ncbi:cation:proton antiporter domain-containing protein [Halocatena pleomorpha]|uniref:cation:proton antiporter domain-containing protein n=1 Tax=Halocatena pleomorpha TaxID=1785090 RepID=UPI001F2F5261|nr:cation:proton antiporter [Halocatena pleomorpha]
MSELSQLVVLIISLGVIAQILSDRFRVPSVLFLIIMGILVGPEGLGLVSLDLFGTGPLNTIVGLSVALIMFEAAFHLKVEKFQEAPRTTFRLVTIGGVIALVGTAVSVRVFLQARWEVAFLIGALLVATGPTVITPILQTVRLHDRVAAALETEGVTNDVTASILAVVVFHFIITPEADIRHVIGSFIMRLGAGLLVGLVVAGIVWYLLEHTQIPSDDTPQAARLLALAGALVAYTSANAVPGASEAGIAAAVTVGIVLGNANLSYEDGIEAFNGDLSLLVLSFVFITLGALIDFDSLLATGFGGIGVVLAIALVIRPLIVGLSTYGTQMPSKERVWMAAVAPRGIIPASIATLFALQLQELGQDDAATLLTGTVFLVILLTVLFEGGLARHLAEYLDVIPMRAIIVGGGRVGRTLAERLEDRGENVVIVEQDPDVIETVRQMGFTAQEGDATDLETLREAGAEHAKIMAAATGDDDVNLLVAQLAQTSFDVETVIARANNRSNVNAFEELGVRTISSTLSVAWAMDNAIERPALTDWMNELERSGDVQEIEITSDAMAGTKIGSLGDDFPNGCIIGLVSRGEESHVPTPDFELEHGDHITIIGRQEAVREAIELFDPGRLRT